MLQVLSIPNAGRLPLLENLPQALQLPVARLGQMPCVDYVVADALLHNTTIVVLVLFNEVPNYKRALQCFSGLRATRVEINGAGRTMLITLTGKSKLTSA